MFYLLVDLLRSIDDLYIYIFYPIHTSNYLIQPLFLYVCWYNFQYIYLF